MTQPTDADRQEACRVYANITGPGGDSKSNKEATRCIDIIARALADARSIPDGYARVGSEDVRVLGTLSMTRDRCAVGWGAKIWTTAGPDHDGPHEWIVDFDTACDKYPPHSAPCVSWGGPQHDAEAISDCFSTREAALARLVESKSP